MIALAAVGCARSEFYMKKRSEADLIWGTVDDQEALGTNQPNILLKLGDFQDVTFEEIYSGQVAKRFSKERLEKGLPPLFKKHEECYGSLGMFRDKAEYCYMFEDIKNYVRALVTSDAVLNTYYMEGLQLSYESDLHEINDAVDKCKKASGFLVYKVAKLFTEKEIRQTWGEAFLARCKPFAPLGEWTRRLPGREDTSG